MTTATALARPQPVQAPGRVPLRLATEHVGTVGRAPFVLLLSTILATGLITLLMLHTLAAQDAFRLHAMQWRAAALSEEQQQLAVAVQREQDPTALAARARRLGMVPAGTLAFIRLRDGRILGAARTAGRPTPSPTPTVTASVSPTPSTSSRPTASARPTTAHHRRPGHRSG